MSLIAKLNNKKISGNEIYTEFIKTLEKMPITDSDNSKIVILNFPFGDENYITYEINSRLSKEYPNLRVKRGIPIGVLYSCVIVNENLFSDNWFKKYDKYMPIGVTLAVMVFISTMIGNEHLIDYFLFN